jgi:hypothetical protein
MQNASRRYARFIVLLMLLALLAVLVAKRQALRIDEAEDEAVQAVVTVKNTVVRDEYVAGAVLVVLALFGFVIWAAIRAEQEKNKPMPPPPSRSK